MKSEKVNMILTGRFEEPCEGSFAHLIKIELSDLPKIEAAIDWLREHGGQEFGNALVEWELHNTKSSGNADLVGLEDVYDELILNGRYCETEINGDFYGATYAPFEEHLKAKKAKA